MKKSYLILAAIASVALASCSNEEYFGDPGGLTGEKAISFSSDFGRLTRAEGAEAAENLGYSFKVYATKTVGTGADAVSNVFAHNAYSTSSNEPYWAWYEENTSNTTASNSSNWEYVGGTGNHGKTGYQVNLETEQTIKYWDRSADHYTFMAFKAKPVGEPAAAAAITNVTPSGFTITGTPTQLANFYVADQKKVESANYGEAVQLTFRNFTSKIRFGIYETIPGYNVKIDKVYYGTSGTSYSETDFGVNGSFSGGATTIYEYNVTYDATTGRAKGSYNTGAAQGYLQTTTNGSPMLSENSIGTTSTTATYDQTGKAYSIIMPNPENTTGMTLKVDITLTNGSTNETIKLEKASAVVPAEYCKWLSNYTYTYLFKISDLTEFDGHLLAPITLDAVIEADDKGNQNTITILGKPSITTYQAGDEIYDDYNETKGNIFVTVTDNTATPANNVPLEMNQTGLETAGNAALFTFGGNHTEAEIEKALLVRTSALSDATVEGRNGITLTPTSGTDVLNLTNKVSDEKVFGDKKVAEFTPSASTNYAFVYTVTGSSDGEGNKDTKYEAVPNLTAGISTVAGYYCNYKYNAASGDAQSDVIYYSKTETPETYTALTTAAPTFFGQTNLTGLYVIDTNSDYIPASGTISSNVEYYYPTEVASSSSENFSSYYILTEGKYTKATGEYNNTTTYYTITQASTTDLLMNYTDFASTTLYISNTEEGTQNTETEPDASTAYYKRTGDSEPYTFTRVYILPQQIPASSYTRDASMTKQACPAGEKAIAGEKYYDKYEMYKGTYAVKVIKVQ